MHSQPKTTEQKAQRNTPKFETKTLRRNLSVSHPQKDVALLFVGPTHILFFFVFFQEILFYLITFKQVNNFYTCPKEKWVTAGVVAVQDSVGSGEK
jgi:hypothetical protein